MKATFWLSALVMGAVLSACAPTPPSPSERVHGHVPPRPSDMSGKNGEQMMCTMEAKLCSDGKTYVSRNGAKGCAFDACPDGK